MRLFHLTLILSLLIPLSSSAQIKSHMSDIFESYFNVVKNLDQEEKINKESLSAALEQLNKAIQTIKNDPMLDSPLFKASRVQITNYVSEINGSKKSDNLAYTKYQIERVINLCVNCHTQLPASAFPPVKRKKILKAASGSNFEKEIQLAYLLRDYSSALATLEEKIKTELKSGKTYSYIEAYLIELVKVQLTYNNDLSGLQKTLNKLKSNTKNKELDRFVASSDKRIKEWMGHSKELESEEQINHFIKINLLPSERELIEQTYLINGENLVNFAIINGKLTNFILNNRDSSKVSEYLYWKGLLENQSDTYSFHSFGDSFLRECIERSPKSKTGQKCFRAYKYSIELGFTGSAGIHIPEDIQKMLANLEQRVGISTKSTERPNKRKIN